MKAGVRFEIGEYLSNSKAASSGGTVQSTPGSSSDKLDLSKVADVLRELQQLQTDNPAEFKQALNDAATKLKDASQQQTDPAQAKFLSDLSDRFQKAADTGDLSQLKPPDGSASGSYSVHGHHHHHHHSAAAHPAS